MEQLEKYLDKKYILKSGRLLYWNERHYNNDTITDKIAEAAIKRFPQYIHKFLTERERKVLEAKIAARSAVKGAESRAADEQTEKKVAELIESGDFDGARELVEKLQVPETAELLLKDIEKAESDADPLEKIKSLLDAGNVDEAQTIADTLKGNKKGAATKLIKAKAAENETDDSGESGSDNQPEE